MFSQINASKKVELRNLQVNNYITITVEGEGNVAIINEGFTSKPTSIQINEGSIETFSAVQTLNSATNTIKLIWNSQLLTSCQDMFKGLPKIISINLTNFDLSNVDNMECFCEECSSLKSVDLSNGDASNVINMDKMLDNHYTESCIPL